jgi:hypothetical protein
MRFNEGKQVTVRMHGTAINDGPRDEASSVRSFRSAPRDGDVLASKRTARSDVYTISIVPGAGHIRARRHSEAIDKVRALSKQLGVNGWVTFDHTHFACVATHRAERTSDVDCPRSREHGSV